MITRRLRGMAAIPKTKPHPRPSKPPPSGKASDRTTKRSKNKCGAPRRAGLSSLGYRDPLADILWVNSTYAFPLSSIVVRRGLIDVVLVVIYQNG
jgi:hypothetical protein